MYEGYLSADIFDFNGGRNTIVLWNLVGDPLVSYAIENST